MIHDCWIATVEAARGHWGGGQASEGAALDQCGTEKALSSVVVGGAFAPLTYNPPQRNWVSKPSCSLNVCTAAQQEAAQSQSWEERYRGLQEKGVEENATVEVPWVKGAPPVPDQLAWEKFRRSGERKRTVHMRHLQLRASAQLAQ